MRTLVILSGMVLLAAMIYQSTTAYRQVENSAVPFKAIVARALGDLPTVPVRRDVALAGQLPAAPGTTGDSEQTAPGMPAPLGTVLAGGDRQEIATHLTHTAEFVDREGRVIRGREAIANALAGFFSQDRGGQTNSQMDSLRFVESGIAIEDGFTTTTPANEQPPIRTRYTAVEVLHEGKWYVASVRERPWTGVSQTVPMKNVGFTGTEP